LISDTLKFAAVGDHAQIALLDAVELFVEVDLASFGVSVKKCSRARRGVKAVLSAWRMTSWSSSEMVV
jgi:hypothetical protein